MAKDNGIQGKKEVLKALKNVMQAVGQKYSIRVGIIGDEAYKKHPDTDLTNAQLGAVHEFGTTITINHPGGQPYVFLQNGQTRFVSKNSKAGQEAIKAGRVTKAHTVTVNVPERSFLRNTLLDKEAQERIFNSVNLSSDTKDSALNEAIVINEILKGNKTIILSIAKQVGAKALEEVQIAFMNGGKPDKWQPITEYTKQQRAAKGHDPAAPPLQSGGDLLDSISFDVKKV